MSKNKNPAFLRWYAYAFIAVALFGALVGEEWVAAAGLIVACNIACTYHICKVLEAEKEQG